MPHRLRASVALVALVVLNVALLSSDTWADPPPGDEVTLDASSAIGQIIDNLGGPSAGPGLALTNLDTELPSNVRCEDEQTKSNPFCARLALAAARAALTDLWLKAKGTVTVKWTIAVAKAVGELFGGGEESTPEEELETK